ncbi:MAG TPA: ATP-binding protein [Tepidisphaeraceae bacterium]|nr:ATP-binding protein [Tepidisphaeraceae bacterium]
MGSGSPDLRGGAELLFQIFADRHGRGSILITSNLPFGELAKAAREKKPGNK